MLLSTLYCKFIRTDLKESFFFPTRECFEELWDYFKMGIPASAMLALEFWTFEIQAVIATWGLGIVTGGAMFIMMNSLTVMMMFTVGFSIAA